MIEKIERIPLREVWEKEQSFTEWLEENIDVLNEVLDLNLSNAEREQAAGTLNVDIVAEDAAGNAVVIENQLEKSNHDHLGKLVTYMATIGSTGAVWIVSDPRPEHVSAVAWLNEVSPNSFYLVKVEAVKIGSSPPAPLLTVIVGPSEETKKVGETRKEIAERYLIRERFWHMLLEEARDKTKLHVNISPSQHNWVGTSAGVRGLGYNYVVREHDAQVELYIDRGRESEEENKEIFDKLYLGREGIEDRFGESLTWERLDGRRACRIRNVIERGGYRDEDEKWPGIHNSLIGAMIRLEKAFKPSIAKLKKWI